MNPNPFTQSHLCCEIKKRALLTRKDDALETTEQTEVQVYRPVSAWKHR